jgi:hypothetical protein
MLFVPVTPVGAVDAVKAVIVIVNPAVSVLHGAASILLAQYVVVVVGFTNIVLLVWPLMMLEPTVAPVPH